MSTRKTGWEKWFYRVVIMVGIVVWVMVTHPDEARRWWRHSGGEVVFVVAVLVLPAVFFRRRRWQEAVGCSVLAWVAVIILRPVLAPFPGHGRQRSCTGNLKQIAIASRLYAEEYDGRLPPMQVRWPDVVEPYIKDWGVFQCSLEPYDNPRGGSYGPDDAACYGLNPYLRGRKLTDIPLPAEVILAWCGDAAGPVMRHNDGCNYAYADGHVKWIPADQDPGIWNPWEPAASGDAP